MKIFVNNSKVGVPQSRHYFYSGIRIMVK